MMEPVDWDAGQTTDASDPRLPWKPHDHDPVPWQIEVEAKMARIETKQDALYAETHAVHLAILRVEEDFAKLVEGVMGAMNANPLLRRLLGGGK